MKRLQCEMCGSQDLVKEGGVFVCQACGTKYSVEEAKKMMVEGTVSVEGTVAVEGSVKIDSSEELQKLYTLARRAKDSDNTENACRYYTEIEMKDPNSWEAYFYLIYFKARTTKIGEIPKDCKNLSHCFPTAIQLMRTQYGNNTTLIQEGLSNIRKDVHTIAEIMLSSTLSVSDVGERYEYRGRILEMMETCGDTILPIDNNIAKQVYIDEINVFISEICFGKYDYEVHKFFTKDALANYEIDAVGLKIQKIDSSYVLPFGLVSNSESTKQREDLNWFILVVVVCIILILLTVLLG
ncbi:MAG: hypothetical protein KBS70_03670 [Bacteroidales bacterium]|nr:hypothetical protein [Candidatus Colicola equi]